MPKRFVASSGSLPSVPLATSWNSLFSTEASGTVSCHWMVAVAPEARLAGKPVVVKFQLLGRLSNDRLRLSTLLGP